MRVLFAAGALAAVLPTLATAQRPAPAQAGAVHREGSIELTLSPSFYVTDRVLVGLLDGDSLAIFDNFPSRTGFGLVARAGYNITPKLGVSLGTGLGMQSGATILQPFLDATYTLDLNARTSPFVAAGLGMTSFLSGDRTGNAGAIPGTTRVTSTNLHLGLGVRHFLSDNIALRAEGRMHYDNYSEFDDPVYNSTFSLGGSYFMGGGPPRDTDADGVPDKRDRCANTPPGATVDLRGCPSDSDNDGILNGLDRCPDTPANTPVDAYGCTRDTDRDGVADNLDRCPNTPANARPLDATGCPVDSDRDGVADYLDRCASTPSGVPVDGGGCPLDSDNDGVTDNNDRCLNTPADARPIDANGCPIDTDRDGVADYLDRCATTAPNTQVNADGCPIQRDADSDGVIDANDRCPNTPAGSRVDATGCPLAALPPAAGATLVLRNVTFSSGGSRLTPASLTYLNQVATAIQAEPAARWEIGGYTDSFGSRAVNLRLSQQRANAVRTYLISRGVPADVITAVGNGPTNFVAPNTTAAGRAQNRRVEIRRLQ